MPFAPSSVQSLYFFLFWLWSAKSLLWKLDGSITVHMEPPHTKTKRVKAPLGWDTISGFGKKTNTQKLQKTLQQKLPLGFSHLNDKKHSDRACLLLYSVEAFELRGNHVSQKKLDLCWNLLWLGHCAFKHHLDSLCFMWCRQHWETCWKDSDWAGLPFNTPLKELRWWIAYCEFNVLRLYLPLYLALWHLSLSLVRWDWVTKGEQESPTQLLDHFRIVELTML